MTVFVNLGLLYYILTSKRKKPPNCAMINIPDTFRQKGESFTVFFSFFFNCLHRLISYVDLLILKPAADQTSFSLAEFLYDKHFFFDQYHPPLPLCTIGGLLHHQRKTIFIHWLHLILHSNEKRVCEECVGGGGNKLYFPFCGLQVSELKGILFNLW